MGILNYGSHFGISLLLAILYFGIQYDFSKKFQRQRDLLYMSAAIFVFSFFICFIVVKIPREVTFGENDVKEFESEEEEGDEEEEGEEEVQSQSLNDSSTSVPFPDIPFNPPSLTPTPSLNVPPLPLS